MGATYSFVSTWQVPASADRCWGEIERMVSRPALRADSLEQAHAPSPWWPSVTVVEPARTLAAGERMTLAVRSPVSYRLRVHLAITDVEPGRFIAASSEGDLRGHGQVDVVEAGAAASVLTFHWDVATERRWMNATAVVLRPVFERAHTQVMREGERGMRAALAGR